MCKEVIVFQPIMDGVERIAIPKVFKESSHIRMNSYMMNQ